MVNRLERATHLLGKC